MKTEMQILREVESFLSTYGHPKEEVVYPVDMTDEYERAKFYVLTHGCRYGLGYECLSWFYRLEDETPGEHWRNANDALYEWDI